MKRLLNSLFVMTQGAWLSQKGENIIVHLNKEESRAFPIHIFDSVLCFGQVSVTPPLMGVCAEHGVSISFFTEYGKFLASVHGPVSGNVLLRKEQYRISDSPQRSAGIVRSLLAAKISNSRVVLQRFLRDHPQDGTIEKFFRENIGQLEGYLAQLRDKDNIEEMRGIEGISARLYFDLFDKLIIQQKDDFKFTERNRRPPRDRVNAMLSFVYTLLTNDVKSALHGVGLDPAVGFLHKDRPGRASLALDMMEEFKSWWADRFVLSLINLKQVKGSGFTFSESGAVIMTEEARKTVISEWQSRKQDEVLHPYTGEKILIGQLPHLQAMLLARHIRGDMQEYPPYIWK